MDVPGVWRPSLRDRLVARAQTDVSAAIKRGLLAPPETRLCADCGLTAECYDHRNYYEPLKVAPVCQRCNILRGPGSPSLTQIDGNRNRNELKPKGKGIRGGGIRWDGMDEGEGFSPRTALIHSEVDWRALEDRRDSANELDRTADAIRSRNRYDSTVFFNTGVGLGGLRLTAGGARATFFKSKDPYFLG